MVAAITGLVVPGNQRHFGAKVATRILPFYCRNFCRRSNQKKCYKHVALELHFRLLLQNRLMDFDETWYGWSTQGPLQVLLFFGQIRPGADPGRGKNRSRGSPSSGNFFFRPEGYSNKPNAKQWSRNMWEEVLLFLVPFRIQIFDAFLTSFWT